MKQKLHFSLFLLLLAFLGKSQTAQWVRYPDISGAPVNCITIDASNNKWVGTRFTGLYKKSSLVTTNYTTGNSGIINNSITAVAVNTNGDVWAGADSSTGTAGICKLSGTTWTSYTAANCQALQSTILSIAFDHTGNVWIGTNMMGLIKFDGTTWTRYTTSNSGLPYNWVSTITVDNLNNIWVGTYTGGIAKFDGISTWTPYYTGNSNLRSNIVWGSAMDPSHNLWFATDSGIAKFNGSTFADYDSMKVFAMGVGPTNGVVWYSGYDPISNHWKLASFNGITRTYYSATPNPGLDEFRSIACDNNSVPWLSSESNSNSEYGVYSFCMGTAPVISAAGGTTICPGGYAILSATPSYSSYQWSDSTGLATDTAKYSVNYSLVATDANGCLAQSNTLSMIWDPLVPVITSQNLNCTTNTTGAASVSVTGGTTPYTYSWSSGQTTNSLSNIPVGTYTLTVHDQHHCVATDTVSILLDPTPTPNICMVTVDSISQHNIVLWDKTNIAYADSFVVYREITTNVYDRLGAIPYSALSEFTDTVRARYFPNTGNPNVGTYRYKLQVRDTCGHYSALSPYHNTIYIAYNNAGVFTWALPYSIENSANPVTNYLLQRDDLSNGNWHTIGSVAGTQQTISDPAYASFQATASWRVVTQWSIVCTPTLRHTNPDQSLSGFSVSLSNTTRYSPAGIQNLSNPTSVKVYPTPGNGNITVETTGLDHVQIQVYSLVGDLVYNSELTNEKSDVSLNTLSKGTYLVHVISTQGQTVRRIVIQ